MMPHSTNRLRLDELRTDVSVFTIFFQRKLAQCLWLLLMSYPKGNQMTIILQPPYQQCYLFNV